jgi:hypothetical protein
MGRVVLTDCTYATKVTVASREYHQLRQWKCCHLHTTGNKLIIGHALQMAIELPYPQAGEEDYPDDDGKREIAPASLPKKVNMLHVASPLGANEYTLLLVPLSLSPIFRSGSS